MDRNLELYNKVAYKQAKILIKNYSTSFSLANSFLPKAKREKVSAVYALVRIADEIVDGTAQAAGLDLDKQLRDLNQLEQETNKALSCGFSSNLMVHAFAHTARLVGIDKEYIDAFFYSMRADLTIFEHSAESLEKYIYGSAEVIGIMCLQIFQFQDNKASHNKIILKEGARSLGAAFQKINFLRDLAYDINVLGRRYFPESNHNGLTDNDLKRIILDIEKDICKAKKAIPLLNNSAKISVMLATELFDYLTKIIKKKPASNLMEMRFSVPAYKKFFILLKVVKTSMFDKLFYFEEKSKQGKLS